MANQDASKARRLSQQRLGEYRVPSVIVTERGDRIRMVTAYDLDAGQRRDYVKRRMQGE